MPLCDASMQKKEKEIEKKKEKLKEHLLVI